jgi:hypothetical protein
VYPLAHARGSVLVTEIRVFIQFGVPPGHDFSLTVACSESYKHWLQGMPQKMARQKTGADSVGTIDSSIVWC